MKFLARAFFALVLSILVAKAASAQAYTGTLYRSKVTDSTTINVPTGYGGWYYNIQSGTIRMKDGAGWFNPRNTTSGSGLVDGLYKDITVAGTATELWNNTMWKGNVRLKTVAALPSNVFSTIGGVADILASSNGLLTIDGVAVAVGDYIIVSNEASNTHDGVYEIISPGTAFSKFHLQARGDSRTDAQIQNAVYFVTDGSTNIGTYWRQTGTLAGLGYDPLLFGDPNAFIKGLANTLDASTHDTRFNMPFNGTNNLSFRIRQYATGDTTAYSGLDLNTEGGNFTTSLRGLGIGNYGYMTFDALGNSYWFNEDGAGGESFGFGLDQASGATFYDGRSTPKGLLYDHDISASFVNESMVSKRYVDASITTAVTPKMTNPMTAAKDVIIGGTLGAPTRLAGGTNNTVFNISSGGAIQWTTLTGTNIAANGIGYGNIAQGGGLSVFGRSASTAGNNADMIGSTDQILRVNGAGNTLGFGAIDLSKSAAVGTSRLPYANIVAPTSTSLLLGRGTSSGDWQEVLLGSGFSMTGNTLNLSGGTGTVTSVSVTSANGFSGSVATSTTTPAITIGTSITGILKGNGTAVSAAVSGTDYQAPGLSWLLASGGTLTGANTIVGSSTNLLNFQFPALGVTPSRGLTIENTTAAATGAQQISPDLTLRGYGWKTTATAASQSVEVRHRVVPVQGTTAPTYNYSIFGSIANGAETELLRLTSAGGIMAPQGIIGSPAATNLSIQSQNTTFITASSGLGGTRFINPGNSFAETSTPPTANVILEAQSTTKAFAMPRMTTTQRNAIPSPLEGMNIYNITTHNIDHYNGTAWGGVDATGIGGSTGATDKRILIANGTGGATVQNSLLGIDASGNIIDANTNELIRTTATASAVNDITVSNAITGGAPVIAATGDDTNVTLIIRGKGNKGVSINGFTDGSTPASGQVAEVLSGIQSTYTNYTTTATYQNVTSVALTAGDWDVSALGTWYTNTGTSVGEVNFVISTTTASAAGAVEGKTIVYTQPSSFTNHTSLAIPPYRVSLSASTTLYLNSASIFTTGNPQFVGGIRAVRVR